MLHRTFKFNNDDIDTAFAERQFSLVFQPKVLLRDGAISGAEAFVRWRHPEYGLIPPGLFLTYLEQEGRVVELTRHVLKEAAKACNVWRKTGQNWDVSVNLSVGDLYNQDFSTEVENLIKLHKLPPGMLSLELPQAITYLGPDRRHDGPEFDGDDRREDSEMAKTWNQILRTVYGLKAKGIRIALDGGGNALAAIEMFEPQPFTEIKVGGATIRQIAMTETAPEQSVTPAKMRFALEMGIATVAVGVEDAHALRAVKEAGFTAAQGTFIGRPVPALSLLEWRPTHLKSIIGNIETPPKPAKIVPPKDTDASKPIFGMRKKIIH